MLSHLWYKVPQADPKTTSFSIHLAPVLLLRDGFKIAVNMTDEVHLSGGLGRCE